MAAPVAALDACVLYRGLLTDVLLWIADAGAFEPVWSAEIHDEWTRNLASRLPCTAITKRRAQMDRAFPAALVPRRDGLVTRIERTCRTAAQRKDAHVVATAIAASADVIVTTNIGDFDPRVLESHGLTKQRPDAFLLGLLRNDAASVLDGVRRHRASLKGGSMTVEAYLSELAGPKAEVPRFAASLTAHGDAI